MKAVELIDSINALGKAPMPLARKKKKLTEDVRPPSWVLKSDKTFAGPNGNICVAYQHIYYLSEKPVGDEVVAVRVSDFDNAIPCHHCKRKVVHVFWVKLNNEENPKPFGSEHVYIALGYPKPLSDAALKKLQDKVANPVEVEKEKNDRDWEKRVRNPDFDDYEAKREADRRQFEKKKLKNMKLSFEYLDKRLSENPPQDSEKEAYVNFMKITKNLLPRGRALYWFEKGGKFAYAWINKVGERSEVHWLGNDNFVAGTSDITGSSKPKVLIQDDIDFFLKHFYLTTGWKVKGYYPVAGELPTKL